MGNKAVTLHLDLWLQLTLAVLFNLPATDRKYRAKLTFDSSYVIVIFAVFQPLIIKICGIQVLRSSQDPFSY